MYIAKTNSTNTLLAEMLQKNYLPDNYTVYTYCQTQGRGQRGNSWESEPGKNLLLSTLLRPQNLPSCKQFIISQIVALSLKKVLDKYVDNIRIKWPNDIYWNDMKIAGILIENVLCGIYMQYSIVGVGLNINQMNFISDAPNPVSLAQITGIQYDKKKILSEFLDELSFLRETMLIASDAIHRDYMASMYRSSDFYFYKTSTETFEAAIVDVCEDGQLILQLRNGEQRGFYFKEIMFVL